MRFGGRDVRAAAEVDEFAGGVERHHRLDGFLLDQFALEGLIPLFVQLDGLGLRQQLALVGNILRRQLVHLLLDARQVFGRERLLAQEFVEKAGVDGRTDAQLHIGEKFEHRRREQVRRRMPKYGQRIGILRGKDADFGVVFQRTRKIYKFAIGARDERFLRQSVRNLLRNVGGRGAARHFLRGPIRQSDLYGVHGRFALR